jgi:hypothetical protein
MGHRTDLQQQPPTPVADDIHATTPQLLQRAAADYAQAQAAARAKEQRGGTGVRQGVLLGGGTR